jgi:hypothetical protein
MVVVFLKSGMPTVLFMFGWRFYFYSNENNEPVHIHVEKAEMEAKFWLDEDLFEIKEAYSFNMSPKDRNLFGKHFDYIIEQWKLFKNRPS